MGADRLAGTCSGAAATGGEGDISGGSVIILSDGGWRRGQRKKLNRREPKKKLNAKQAAIIIQRAWKRHSVSHYKVIMPHNNFLYVNHDRIGKCFSSIVS